MPKKDSSYLNQDLGILEKLLIYGRSIPYRRKIQGYGLVESDFGKKDIKIPKQVTRRIFRNRKENMLSLKLIRKIKSDDERPNVFAITPLGIVFLFHYREIEIPRLKQQLKELGIAMRI